MAETSSITGNQNDDSSSSSRRKRFKIVHNGGVAPWSDVNHDVLFLVTKQLGVVDFLAFSRVCKSWRSFALSNRNMFMACRPLMREHYDMMPNKNNYFCLEDSDKRKLKIIFPHFASRICVGSTCGYLILFGEKTRDFWLVNPITRHELHFPDYPVYVALRLGRIMKAILVFSPSISGWVLVVLRKLSSGNGKLLFYIAGKRRWNHVSSTIPIIDLHFFKGKIYTLHSDCSLGELIFNLNQKHKSTLLETKTFLKPDFLLPQLVASDENLYLIDLDSEQEVKVLQQDFGEMKWVLPEKTIGEYAFFISQFNCFAAIKPMSWIGSRIQYKSYGHFLHTDKSRKCMFYYEWMWYFPYECLNVICDE